MTSTHTGNIVTILWHWLVACVLTVFVRNVVFHRPVTLLDAAIWAAAFVCTIHGIRWWNSYNRHKT